MIATRLLALGATCLLLAAPALAAPAALWRGPTGGGTVALMANDLVITAPGGGRRSLRADFLAALETPPPGEEHHDISWKLLSVVGPLVSVETHGDGNVEGAAHPYAYGEIQAYDARRGGVAAKLTDYFPAADVLAALKGDRLVRQALAGHVKEGGKGPTTLPKLLEAISGYQGDDCVWGFDDQLLSRFAFHHVKGNQVAVRFGLSHGCEVARGSLTILAVYLPIPRALARDLAAAQAGTAGFLVPKAPKGVAMAGRHSKPLKR